MSTEQKTIASELMRISEQKKKIKEKLQEMGLVEESASPNINELATKINNIPIKTFKVPPEVKENSSITLGAGYYPVPVDVLGITNETEDLKKIAAFDAPIEPTKSLQEFSVPENYYGWGSFVVNPISEKYTDVSDANASSYQVLSPYTFYSNGSNRKQQGTMTNNQAVTKTITKKSLVSDDGSYYYEKIAKGYHDGNGIVRVAKVDRADMKVEAKIDEEGQIAITIINDQSFGLTGGFRSKAEYIQLSKDGKKVTAKVVDRNVEISEEIDDATVSVIGGLMSPQEGFVSAEGTGVTLSGPLDNEPTEEGIKYIKVDGSGSVSRGAILINQTAGYIEQKTDEMIKPGTDPISSNIATKYYTLPKELIDTTVTEKNAALSGHIPKGEVAFVNGKRLDGEAEWYDDDNVFKLTDEDLAYESYFLPIGFHNGDSSVDYSIILTKLEEI